MDPTCDTCAASIFARNPFPHLHLTRHRLRNLPVTPPVTPLLVNFSSKSNTGHLTGHETIPASNNPCNLRTLCVNSIGHVKRCWGANFMKKFCTHRTRGAMPIRAGLSPTPVGMHVIAQ